MPGPGEGWRAGAARRVVTPEPLLPVTAGAGATRPATGKRGELEVRVAVVEAGGTRVALVSMPFIGWPTWLCQRVQQAVQQVPAAHVLIGATHTHGAPDVYGFLNEDGAYAVDVAYLEQVCRQTAELIDEAAAALAPATLYAATGPAQGKIAYNLYAPDLYDPRLNTLHADAADGTRIFTLVNYAIHPEVLLRAPICTPDLVGPLYDCLDAAAGGCTLFLNGAQGGMVTADIRTEDGGEREEWSECLRIGEALCYEVLRIASSAETLAPTLHCAGQPLTFPVKPPMQMMMQTCHPDIRPHVPAAETYTVRQNLVNFGAAQALTIPGEALPNIGYYLKRNMRGRHNLLFGLTNDAIGYLLTRVDYDSFAAYDYITATSLGEEAGEILIAESLKLIAASPAPA